MTDQATTTRIPPVRRQIVVPVAPSVAFDVFTSEIGQWWSLDDGHSVHGEGGTVRFVDGKLIEENDASVAVWGSVLEWMPPEHVRITWHPGQEPSVHTEVSVRFAAVGDGSQTLVTLEHSGWERLAEPIASRDEYANGWVGVLGGYADRAAVSAPHHDHEHAHGGNHDQDAPVSAWLAMSHTPGINAPDDGNVFGRPEFALHMTFVMGLLEKGLVVGAGPIGGRTGHGMTIVRVPLAEAGEYVRQAREDDRSVTSGLLQVDVAVWDVRMSG